MKRISPKQWCRMQRLLATGCPLDITNLCRPAYPMQVTSCQTSPRSDTNVYFVESVLVICFGVQIDAFAPVIISGYRIEADWLHEDLRWVPACYYHPGYHCVHPLGGRFAAEKLMTNRTYRSGRLRPGERLQ